MVSTPAPPPAPDPNKAAAAQAGMNRDTAQTQQLTNMINQIGTQGTITYNPTGTNYSFKDSKGNIVDIPQYQQITSLSPEEQHLYNLTSQIKANVGQIGVDQSELIGNLLRTPVNLNNEATEARLNELGSKRLDPRFAREEESLRTRLANQGVSQGSEAWNNAFGNFSQTKNDAYNQLYLTGREQATREALAERNQPINEISALLSGSQVSMPQQMQTPQSQVAGVDYMGMLNSQYQAQMQAYGQQLAARSSALGGIFGVLGKGIGVLGSGMGFSDRRLKSNIVQVGTWPNGLNVYEYDIFGRRERGFMADEVAGRFPEAVGEYAGYLTVNYAIAMEAA
jgi:hypothetical protein